MNKVKTMSNGSRNGNQITADRYQAEAHKTACYGGNQYYPVLGLCEEVGEFQGKLAKFIRKHHGMEPYVDAQDDSYKVAMDRSLRNERLPKDRRDPYVASSEMLREAYADSAEFRDNAKKELGDIQWMVAEVCTAFGWRLSEVMGENLAKLADRQRRGVIVGSGDNR